jgi:hypothetical protein
VFHCAQCTDGEELAPKVPPDVMAWLIAVFFKEKGVGVVEF